MLVIFGVALAYVLRSLDDQASHSDEEFLVERPLKSSNHDTPAGVCGELDDLATTPGRVPKIVPPAVRERSPTGRKPSSNLRVRVLDRLDSSPLNLFSANVFTSDEPDLELKARVEPGRLLRDTAGVAIFSDLEPGDYVVVVKAPGYRDLLVPGLSVPREEDLLDLFIDRGTHITGKVVDAEGRPVRQMAIYLKCVPFNSQDHPPARNAIITDREGCFLFGDLVPGEYEILLQSLGDPLDSATGIFLAEGGSFSKTFVIPLFNTLKFEISAFSGIPLNNVRIRLVSETRLFRVRTERDGRAILKRIPPGEYELVLHKPRFLTHREKVKLLSMTGEITFERTLDMQK